jgi:RNA binding exosome subunit
LRQELIQSVELSTIAHATEDPSKVDKALQNMLQDIHQPFTRRYLEGHHGNPIVKIEAKLAYEDASQFAYMLIHKLSKSERLIILRDLQLHSDDDGNLYIRVDKQRLLQGTLQIAEDDPIRVKIKFNRLMGDCKKSMMQFLESD